MKKLIVLTAVTSILLVGGNQQAWAGNRTRNTRQTDDDYRAFKKIVRVLDVIINDGHHAKGRNHVSVRRYYHPRKTCYRRGHHKVCYLNNRGRRQYEHDRRYKKYSKRVYHDHRDYYGRDGYR